MQGHDKSGSRECRKPGLTTTFAGISESKESNSLRERDARIGFSKKFSPMAVVESKSRSSVSKNMTRS